MASLGLNRELTYLVLQFLQEENWTQALHAYAIRILPSRSQRLRPRRPNSRLERDSGAHFNFPYFSKLILEGLWDEVENYLCGFTSVEDNPYSMKIFFEIRKQKYLEALDRFHLHLPLAPRTFWPCRTIPGRGGSRGRKNWNENLQREDAEGYRDPQTRSPALSKF